MPSLNEVLAQSSEAVRRLNPQVDTPPKQPASRDDLDHLFRIPERKPAAEKTSNRIRQKKKRTGSQLQSRFGAWLQNIRPGERIREEAITLQIANGVTYRPDFTIASKDPRFILDAYEVKGPHFWPQAKVKLKCAAASWPEIRFYLVREDRGQWTFEHIAGLEHE